MLTMKSQSFEMMPVKPVRPVAPWQGGKRVLAKRLVKQIGAIEHRRYVEPFVGMGGVFFRRDSCPRVEVINDISADVANLFRLLQRHYQQLLDTLKWQINSRADFDRLVKVDPDTLTDLERAARFLYLQKAGFGGKVSGRTFGVDYSSGARFDLTRLVPMLEDVHERLSSVTIERLPFDQCIAKYDRKDGQSLFYIDPPYWDCEDDYGKNLFSPDDFIVLRDRLKMLNGRFVMSINDVPEIRELFAEFIIEPVDVTYGVGGGSKPFRELIISN